MLFKYVVKNVARAAGNTVTFMPKPLFRDNGSGMHCHQSLWKDGEPLFYDEVGYGGLSDLARSFFAGCSGAPLAARVDQPDRQLLPPPGTQLRGAGQPGLLTAQQVGLRPDPDYRGSPKAKRIEFRVPDPSSNPYIAFAAMLMAGLDGIRNKIEPPEPVDKDLYELPPDEALAIPKVPGSLEKVLESLEADHEYLLEGGVFTPDLIETWVDYKRTHEIDPVAAPASARVRAVLRLLAASGCLTCADVTAGR